LFSPYRILSFHLCRATPPTGGLHPAMFLRLSVLFYIIHCISRKINPHCAQKQPSPQKRHAFPQSPKEPPKHTEKDRTEKKFQDMILELHSFLQKPLYSSHQAK